MHNKPIVNKIARCLTILILMAAPVIGATSTKTLITTNDISSLRAGFRDFRFKVHGFETTKFEHYFTNGAAGVTASDYSFLFRVLGTFGGSNTYFIALENSDITKSGASVNFTIQTTNIPPNGKYKAELLGYTGNITNFSRSFGRGTWTVTDSIYDEDSIGTFPFPSFSVTDLTYTLTASNGWGVSVADNSKIYSQYPTNLSAFTVISDTDFKGFNVTNVNRLTVNNLTITNPSSMKLGNVVFSESAGKLRGNSSNIAYEAYVIAATNGLTAGVTGPGVTNIVGAVGSNLFTVGSVVTNITGAVGSNLFAVGSVVTNIVGGVGSNLFAVASSAVLLAGETNKVVYRDGRYAMTGPLNLAGNIISNAKLRVVDEFYHNGENGLFIASLNMNPTNLAQTGVSGGTKYFGTQDGTNTYWIVPTSYATDSDVTSATNAVLIKSTNFAITAANAYTVAATNAAATPHIFFDVRQTNRITAYHNTILQLPWNLVTHNIGSVYNADSNGAVIVQAGWYELNMSVTRIGLLANGQFAWAAIYTNGIPWKAGLESTYGGAHTIDAVGYFGVDDLLTTYIWYFDTTSATRFFGSYDPFYDQQTISEVGSFFQGRLVRK